MRCPYCSHEETKVTDSREAGEGIRRRRECLLCGLRFNTLERLQANSLLVVKQDGRREEFDRDKMRSGILMACAKRPVPVDTIDKLVEDIERELLRLGRAEVPSSLIGQMVVERLRHLDRVAYVRFASVYRNFQDIESFRQEVDALLDTRETPRVQTSGRRGRQPSILEAQLALPLNNGNGQRRARQRRKRPAEAPGNTPE